MKTIEIEDDLYKYILNNIEAFGETPSQILRRLLALSEDNHVTELVIKNTVNNTPQQETNKKDDAVKPVLSISETSKKSPKNIDADSDSDDYEYQSVRQLFDDKAFTSEAIITNKFMMMLTTMYFEKKAYSTPIMKKNWHSSKQVNHALFQTLLIG